MAPANAKPAAAALQAIENADVITIGPGSLFTSLVPNLLVPDLSKAIKQSRAIKVYVCNLMTQANESLNLTASQHILAIYKHARHDAELSRLIGIDFHGLLRIAGRVHSGPQVAKEVGIRRHQASAGASHGDVHQPLLTTPEPGR